MPSPMHPGSWHINLKDGRSYLLHQPSISMGKKQPLVMLLHGGGGHAEPVFREQGFVELAEAEGFVLVVPNGGAGRLFSDRFLTWKAAPGYCGMGSHDDVSFLKDVLDHVQAHFSIDPSAIFLTGHSNGAMMTYRMGLAFPHLFRAIAPVGGACVNLIPIASDSTSSSTSSTTTTTTTFISSSSEDPPYICPLVITPTAPLSIPTLHIHSIDDPRALYRGGLGPPFPGTNNRINHPPLEGTLLAWASVNRCGPALVLCEDLPCRSSAAYPTHFARWFECPRLGPDSPVIRLIQLTGTGHGWPGRRAKPFVQSFIGEPTDVIDATFEIWQFFKGYLETKS